MITNDAPSVQKTASESLRSRYNVHLSQLSRQPLTFLLYSDELPLLRGQRHRGRKREGAPQWRRQGATDLLLQEGWRTERMSERAKQNKTNKGQMERGRMSRCLLKVFSSSSHRLTSPTNFLWKAFTLGFNWKVGKNNNEEEDYNKKKTVHQLRYKDFTFIHKQTSKGDFNLAKLREFVGKKTCHASENTRRQS